jgi:hypothetical protein
MNKKYIVYKQNMMKSLSKTNGSEYADFVRLQMNQLAKTHPSWSRTDVFRAVLLKYKTKCKQTK